jgi:predicted nucleotide-binding protein
VAEYSFHIPFARISREIVQSLLDELRPFEARACSSRLPAALEAAAGPADDTGLNGVEWNKNYAEALQSHIDDGGVVDWRVVRYETPMGVLHVLDPVLTDVQSFPIEFRAVVVEFHARVWFGEIFTITLAFDEQGCAARVVADEDIEVLADRVKVTLESTVDEQLRAKAKRAFKVFLGHGGDPQWKYLERALRDNRFLVEAFESEERAGYHTLVVVDEMIRSSDVAVVVMTGEDELSNRRLRARENVIHEIGFCQGALGIDRTIILMQEGISEPTNIQGLTQIRFPAGRLIDVEPKIIEALEQRRKAFDFSTR